MTEPQVPIQTYDELLHAIRDVQAQSQKRLDQAVNQEKIREAWETGKLIDAHVLQFKERAGYGDTVILRLSEDLGTSHTELKYVLQFFRTYPIGPPADQLSWAHYRELLSINEIETRKKVTAEAVRQNWTRDQLREEVRRRQTGFSRLETEKIYVVKPGKVNTYRVVKAAHGPYRGQLGLDLGFSNYFQPDGISQFKEGDFVTVESGKLKKVAAAEEALFTYNAYVTQIIDGDTFHALVDLGFKFITEQKLRLRGLDAPEILNPAGRDTKEFLQKQLPASGVPVLIRTSKFDKYDRYLADIWVNGTWLNQKLIDNGLALRVSE